MKRLIAGAGIFLLGLTIIAAMLVCFENPHGLDSGGPYLIAASCTALFCLLTSRTARAEERKGEAGSALWLLQDRVAILYLVSWQLVVIGGLNIWASCFPASSVVFAVSCILLILWVLISDRLVALTDRASQAGGSRPMFSRSRRLFFWGLLVYPASTLAIAAAAAFTRHRQFPTPFQPPQLSLLFVAVLSMGIGALSFQRYRVVLSSGKSVAMCSLGAAAVLFSAGVFTFLGGLSLFNYVVSSLIVISIAANANYLLRARSSS